MAPGAVPPTPATRFAFTGALLQSIVADLRPRFQALGIEISDVSNPTGHDWVQAVPAYGWEFRRTSKVEPYTAACIATVRYSSGLLDETPRVEPDRPSVPHPDPRLASTPDLWEALWRAEAWQGVSPNFHVARGQAMIGPEVAEAGAFERLVFALLRRAAPAFPELLEDAGWPGFAPLPAVGTEIDHLLAVRTFHRQWVEPWTGPPVGCTEAEIDALELRLGIRLPLAYRQYLRFMGADRKGPFQGSDWFLESAGLNDINDELAYQELDFCPTRDTFTFMSHQGYIFGWMDLPVVADDPPVHFYAESGKQKAVVDYARFTDLVMAELKYMSYFTRRVR